MRNEQPYGLWGSVVAWLVIALFVVAFSCGVAFWYGDLVSRFAQ